MFSDFFSADESYFLSKSNIERILFIKRDKFISGILEVTEQNKFRLGGEYVFHVFKTVWMSRFTKFSNGLDLLEARLTLTSVNCRRNI